MEPNDRSREAPSASSVQKNPALGALRALLTLLVVAHHAALAYISWAPPAPVSLLTQPRLWLAFPISDVDKARALDLFTGWNDTWFMALFFLVAGVVAWPSLARKGAGAYFRDRLRRLGLPFLFAAGLLAPLAYFPTWLAIPRQPSVQPGNGSFAEQWLALGSWPAGPAWFLWVLLAFAGAAALVYRFAPEWGTALGRLSERLARAPIFYFLALLAITAAAYLPLAAHFRPETWLDFGPFWIQISRALLYAVYFAAGAGIGAGGLDRGLLDPAGRLARRWPLWAGAAALSFGLAMAVLFAILGAFAHGGPSVPLLAAGNLAFVLCCATTSLAVLGLCVRRVRRSPRWLANLEANAFGIYLLHYAAVSWLQLALLPVALPGSGKWLLVFIGAVAASWLTTALLRRMPALARLL
ncbi:MAG: acyltransferase [Thermoanaerobaculia bacterium]